MRAGSECLKTPRFAPRAAWAGLLLFVYASAATAETRILALEYGGSPLDPNTYNLERNLLGPGYNVTFQWGADYGTLANYLGQGTFDQVWIWDQLISSLSLMNAADKAALSTWYATHPNIALDSRTLAVRYENDATETQLAHNIRDQFAASGGGLWLGGTVAQYSGTVNSWLSYSGAGLFTGSYENGSLLSGVPGHPFLADLDVQGLRFSALGSFVRSAGPTVGPGGVPLQTVVWDSEGHPLVTTNVPEPGTVLLVAAWAALLCARREPLRRRCRGAVR